MNYYVYVNAHGLTEEQVLETHKYAKSIVDNKFKGMLDNTIYLTYKDTAPFIYKVTHTDADVVCDDSSFNPWVYQTVYNMEHNKIPCYTVRTIDEELGGL